MLVVVTFESNLASYFYEAGNLSGSNADMRSEWLGHRVRAPRGVGGCLGFQIGKILRTFTISSTTSTFGVHLGFERDYNYHTAFRACYVIMHKVY